MNGGGEEGGGARNTLRTVSGSSTSGRKVSRDGHLGSSVSAPGMMFRHHREDEETEYLLDHVDVSISR